MENYLQRGGVWYVRARIKGRDVWRSTRQTDWKAAKRVGTRILAELEEISSSHSPTLSQWWQTYQRTHLEKKALTTQEVERAIARPFVKMFGDWAIKQITKSDCVGYLNVRASQVKPATLRNEQQKLHTLFQQAVEEGLLPINPFHRITKPPRGVRTRVLAPEEQERLLEALAQGDRKWLLWMLSTGLRIGDRVVEALPDRLRVVGKGKKQREVPRLGAAREIVLESLPERSARGWRAVLKAACLSAGVAPLTPHILRHTFATRYLKGGGDIYILSKILGHASVQVTESVYAHLLTEDLLSRSSSIDLGVAGCVAEGKILDFPRPA